MYYEPAHNTHDDAIKHQAILVLKFCTLNGCVGNIDCYCCVTIKLKPLCYTSRNECEAVCPTCNPKCPPAE
ncbi:hypothetical protein BS78_08G032100 [Paspalum vaginatum]|nr:hypothetical protein BS78_08G032100 [Paspalum vaginatum]